MKGYRHFRKDRIGRGEVMLYVKEWFEDNKDLTGRNQKRLTRMIWGAFATSR